MVACRTRQCKYSKVLMCPTPQPISIFLGQARLASRRVISQVPNKAIAGIDMVHEGTIQEPPHEERTLLKQVPAEISTVR
jgi:hypothetical protein